MESRGFTVGAGTEKETQLLPEVLAEAERKEETPWLPLSPALQSSQCLSLTKLSQKPVGKRVREMKFTEEGQGKDLRANKQMT